MDAFDVSQISTLLETLRTAFGPEIPEATHEPTEPFPFRGGPYLLGNSHRRAWRFRWDQIPPEMRPTLDREALERIKESSPELIVQWADNLPFVVVVIRAPPEATPWELSQASEGLLNALPGRLGPDNRTPRSETQLVVCAKIRSDRMMRIQEMMQDHGQDESLRQDLAAGLHPVVKSLGAFRLERLYPNLLLVEGDGWGDNIRSAGHFRAFVFSMGNLGPHRAWEWDIPLWIPSGIGTSDWISFNFHPFLFAAIRHAHHVGIEAGRLDESLNRVSTTLSGSDGAAAGSKALATLHRDLIGMHTTLHSLSTVLHTGSTRSPVPLPREGEWEKPLQYESREDRTWPILRPAPAMSDILKVTKAEAEQNTRQVLNALEQRVDRALDLVAIVENRYLNRSMRRWTMGAAIIAAIGILLSALDSQKVDAAIQSLLDFFTHLFAG